MPFAINQGFGSTIPQAYNDITEDYAIYLSPGGSTWNAKSRITTYPNYSDPSFNVVLQNAINARSAVGGKFAIKDSATSTAKIAIPTTRNLNWFIEGQGDQITVITAGATHPADYMLECNKAGWGAPQDKGTVHINNISFNPANIAHGILNLPYTIMDIGRVYMIPNVPSGHDIVAGGGAGGPTHPAQIKSLKFDYVSGARNNRLLALWYDTLQVQQLAAAVNVNSATQDIFDLNGEGVDIGQLVFYIGASGQARNIINANGIYLTVANTLLITSAPAATVASLCKATGDAVCFGRIEDGIPVTDLWADNTTKGLVRRLELGGLETIPAASANNMRTDGVAEYFGAASVNSTEFGRRIYPRKRAFVIGLNIELAAAPGAGKSYTFTLMKTGVASSMAVTIADANTSGSTTANPFEIAATDSLSVRDVATGTPTATLATATIKVLWL